MRTFEVRINKTTKEVGEGLETEFGWPTWWNEVVESVDVVAYEDTDKRESRVEGCVCVCDDEVWEYIKAKNDKAINPLNEQSANAKGRAWRPQVVKIHDPVGVLAACAKAAIGRALTVKEKKSLDPDDPTKGVGRSKMFDVRKICIGHGDELNGE